jgi:hypothetical protein
MQYDHLIARISFDCGVLLILAALIWGGWELKCRNRALMKNDERLIP